MRKEAYVLIGFLMMAMWVFVPLSYTSSTISVKVLKYDPSPALPGKYMDLWVSIANEGDEALNDVSVSFVDSFPFSLVKAPSSNLLSLPPYQTYVLKFRVLVSNKAVIGTNYAYIKVTVNTNKPDEMSVKERLPIEVKEVREAINLINYSYPAEKAYPGGTFPLRLNIQNQGNEGIHNIVVSLDLSSTPLTPTTIPSTTTLPYLSKGESKEIVFPLSVDPECEASSYRIPVTFTYTDNNGQQKEVQYTIGILINKPTSYLLSLDPPYITCSGKGDVVLRIDNNGIGNMKLVTTTLYPPEGVEVLSSKSVYVGNIDSDDYGTATFSLLCTKPGKKELKFRIEYRDDANTPRVDEKTLPLQAYTTQQLYFLGIKKKSNTTYYLVALLLLFLLYLLYKKTKFKHILKSKKQK